MNDNKKNNLLFHDFSTVTKKEWTDKAIIDLKGAEFNRKLVWKNLNNIDLQPFYTPEDQKEFLQNTGKNSDSLVNYRRIVVKSAKKANKLAKQAVEEGINGLLFDLEENVPTGQFLKEIDLNKISVSFILRYDEISFAKEFFSFVKEQEVKAESLKGYFDQNIIYKYVTSGEIEQDQCDKVIELIELAKDFPNFKTISVSGAVYLDSGANQVQEIAYTLNSLVFFIEKFTNKGIELKTVFDNLHFELAIGSEFFVEIGKFRAFNNLLHSVAKKYGINEFSYNLTAKTSIWTKSITDANTNMLRATTETMAAILGNVDGVEIDAYDKEFKEQNDFSSRIAGNIATILKEESYFGKVENPVDGSYYIEEVSSKLAKRALALFIITEEHGGFFLYFENGIIQKQIAEIRMKKIKLLSKRRLAMVGVNKYPNLMETIDVKDLYGADNTIEPGDKVLRPRRASEEIELLRRNTEIFAKQNNHRPVVELTSFGNLTMRKARATFAYDFMGVSGYKVMEEQSFSSAEKSAENSALSASDIVVICSSDQDYTESAVDYVRDFRAKNKDKVLLLAGNPTNIENELIEAGLDGFIHIQSDIIQVLSSIQNKIQNTLKPLEL